MGKMIIYHGSDHTITKPEIHLGKINNDYGQGFYCTENIELAKEWACKKDTDGYVNVYELDLNDLKILNLNSEDKNILNWMAVLLKNRSFTTENTVSKAAKKYLIDNYYINTDNFDIVKGYRADDSYFSFAQAFISNSISVQTLSKALKLGKLGEQIALISEKSFNQLKYIKSIPVDKSEYRQKFVDRDTKARKDYKAECENTVVDVNDIFIMDIIRNRGNE